MQRTLIIYLLIIFAGILGWDEEYTTFPTVRIVLGGGVIGWPCVRAGHPVGIYKHPYSSCGGSSSGGQHVLG